MIEWVVVVVERVVVVVVSNLSVVCLIGWMYGCEL